MESDLLTRVMKLAEKTGAFAVMPFDAYEEMAGSVSPRGVGLTVLSENSVETMSRQALVDRINQEISAWNTAQQSQKEIDDLAPMDVLDEEANEEQYYLEPIE
jgi:hypothetical protein